MSVEKKQADMQDLREKILAGEPAKLEKQRKDGKLTARERILKLLDEGSFVELDVLAGAGVVTGFGTVEDLPVYLYAQDFTISGGSVGLSQAKKIEKVAALAAKSGAPLVAMCDSAGANLLEGAGAQDAYAKVFAAHTHLAGIVPQIAMVLGPCVGGAAIVPSLCDLTVMVKKIGQMMPFGPQVIAAQEGKERTAEQIGGADVQEKAGNVHFVCENEDAAFAQVRALLQMLPSNCDQIPPMDTSEDLNRLLDVQEGCDPRELIDQLVDGGVFYEVQKNYGTAVRLGFARLGGRSVGVMALSGKLCSHAMGKSANFVSLCNAFSLPVVSLCDVEGFALESDTTSTMSAAASMVEALTLASCAKVSLITGAAYGAAYSALSAKSAVDVCYAWPSAVIAPLSPDAAVIILCSEELAKGANRAELEDAYKTEKASALFAAQQGLVDDIIDPATTRQMIIYALEMLG